VIDFVCMANDPYLRWMSLCVQALKKTHPASTVHINDLSDRKGAIAERFEGQPGIRYRHFPPSQWRWPRWIDHADFDFIWPNFSASDEVKYHVRRLRTWLGERRDTWMIDKRAHVQRQRYLLRIFAQKPYVFRDALAATRKHVVFIDVDAIALKDLAPVFERDFDFAVTAEEPRDVIIGPEPAECTERPPYPYKAINVGVMFARNTPRVQPLIDAWIAEMETVRHLSLEQTALANLIHRFAPDFFQSHWPRHDLALPGGRVGVMALPMSVYNFTKIQKTQASIAPDAVVAHFCGGKKQEQHWGWVSKMIDEQLSRE